jgi:protein-S-isoprenylcysteine O-methyltransferase Ste14
MLYIVVKWSIFAAASLVLLALSWRSLRDRRSHGFYRFFAWVAILALITLNAESWFQEPLAPHQLIAWVLLIASLVLVVHSFWLLRVVGKPLGPVENTTRLVAVGAYRYIRHPLYASLLLLGWGTFFKHPSWTGAVLGAVMSLLLFATARFEEVENLLKFGPDYQAYMKNTKMFIPFVL